MTDSTTASAAARAALPEEIARATPAVASGARWFWWIAGLTLVNLACDAAHANVNFVLGLAFTQLAHAMLAPPAAYVIDAAFIGGFWLLGQQAQAGRGWAFVLGALVYLADGLVYLQAQDWMPVAFHAFALFSIARGFLALRGAMRLRASS